MRAPRPPALNLPRRRRQWPPRGDKPPRPRDHTWPGNRAAEPSSRKGAPRRPSAPHRHRGTTPMKALQGLGHLKPRRTGLQPPLLEMQGRPPAGKELSGSGGARHGYNQGSNPHTGAALTGVPGTPKSCRVLAMGARRPPTPGKGGLSPLDVPDAPPLHLRGPKWPADRQADPPRRCCCPEAVFSGSDPSSGLALTYLHLGTAPF